MEIFSALLPICAGNSLVPGEFPAQRPVTRGFDVFFDLRLNNRLSKQSWGLWFETLSRPLWRHCNRITAVPILNPARQLENDITDITDQTYVQHGTCVPLTNRKNTMQFANIFQYTLLMYRVCSINRFQFLYLNCLLHPLLKIEIIHPYIANCIWGCQHDSLRCD